jgi:hypothetical protein
MYRKNTVILLYFFECILTFNLMYVLKSRNGAEQYFISSLFYILSLLIDENYSSCLMVSLYSLPVVINLIVIDSDT